MKYRGRMIIEIEEAAPEELREFGKSLDVALEAARADFPQVLAADVKFESGHVHWLTVDVLIEADKQSAQQPSVELDDIADGLFRRALEILNEESDTFNVLESALSPA